MCVGVCVCVSAFPPQPFPGGIPLTPENLAKLGTCWPGSQSVVPAPQDGWQPCPVSIPGQVQREKPSPLIASVVPPLNN